MDLREKSRIILAGCEFKKCCSIFERDRRVGRARVPWRARPSRGEESGRSDVCNGTLSTIDAVFVRLSGDCSYASEIGLCVKLCSLL